MLFATQVVLALFLSLFPAVFGAIGVSYVMLIVLYVPIANARREVLMDVKTVWTEVMIEQEMAKRHPALYKVRISTVPIFALCFGLIYGLSFVFLMSMRIAY